MCSNIWEKPTGHRSEFLKFTADANGPEPGSVPGGRRNSKTEFSLHKYHSKVRRCLLSCDVCDRYASAKFGSEFPQKNDSTG